MIKIPVIGKEVSCILFRFKDGIGIESEMGAGVLVPLYNCETCKFKISISNIEVVCKGDEKIYVNDEF